MNTNTQTEDYKDEAGKIILQKWTSEAGPRQTKEAQQALKKLLNAGNGTEYRRTDSQGKDYEIVSYCFGQKSPEEAAHFETVKAVFNRINRKYSATMTRENFRDVIADVLAEIPVLTASRPVKDERKTADQLDAERRKRSEAEAVHKAEQEKANEAARITAAALLENPAYAKLERSEGSTKSRWALAASNIRRELKAAFPGHSFSVTSDSFSMGDSINIAWTDGPTGKEVEAIADKYEDGHFNGMEDIYESKQGDARLFTNLFGGSKYIHANRHISKELADAVEADYTANHAPGNLEDWEREQVIRRETNALFSKCSLYGKGAFIRIIDLKEAEGFPRCPELSLICEELPTAKTAGRS